MRRTSRAAYRSARVGATGGPSFVEGSDAPGAAAGLDSLYGGVGAGSWLNTPLPSNTAVDPGSSAAVGHIVNMKNAFGPWLNGVNSPSFSSTISVVPADQPLVPITPIYNASQSYAGALQQLFANGFPYPSTFLPNPNPPDTDAAVTVIQPDYEVVVNGVTYKGRIFESWVTYAPSQSASGGWEAGWGGRATGVVNQAYWKAGHWVDWWWGDAGPPNDWTANGIATEHTWGAMATSIPMWSTIVSRLDVIRGVMNHPIGLEMPLQNVPDQPPSHGLAPYVWPAQRNDGASHWQCRQGSRFRLPAGYTINSGWPWFTQLLATGARDYGLVFCDTVGPTTGPTFRIEPGAPALTPSGTVDIATVTAAFPWADLQQIAIGSDANYNPTV